MTALGGRLSPETELVVVYEGTNISADVAPYVIGFRYVDNAAGKVDDLTLTLRDDEGLWVGAWAPTKGDTITVTIRLKGPPGTPVGAIPCGQFTVDEISASGPPRQFEIKAASVPVDRSIRRQKKSRAWEAVTLYQIASDMAGTGGLALYYDAPEIEYSRRDQHDETDLAFLDRLCIEEGLSLKVTDQQLVIFSEERAESTAALGTYAPETVESWRLTTQAHDVFAACTVAYTDPDTGKTLEYTFRDPNVTDGKTKKLPRRVDSLAAAERLAKKELRLANKHETTGSITVRGEPQNYAGGNITLADFGLFSGKYAIESVTHSVGNGYTQALEIRKVLEGY